MRRINVLCAVTWVVLCALAAQGPGALFGGVTLIAFALYRNHLAHVEHDAAVRRAVGRRCSEIGMYSSGGHFSYPTHLLSDVGAQRLRRALDDDRINDLRSS